jgi:hypothetical protein
MSSLCWANVTRPGAGTEPARHATSWAPGRPAVPLDGGGTYLQVSPVPNQDHEAAAGTVHHAPECGRDRPRPRRSPIPGPRPDDIAEAPAYITRDRRLLAPASSGGA